MKQIECSGPPYEVRRHKLIRNISQSSLFQIGFTHGAASKEEIKRSIELYSTLFWKKSRLQWHQVQDLARDFQTSINTKWPRYYEEMKGEIQSLDCDTQQTIKSR